MKRSIPFAICTLAWILATPQARGAPSAGSAQAREAEPDAWFLLPWQGSMGGAALDGVGRIDGQEADSLGPAGFAISPGGDVFVLDRVNLRVLVVAPDGAPEGEIPLPASTFEDIEQVDGQAILLLDRSVGQGLLVLDLAGRPVADVTLPGRGIPHPGQVTAILPRPDGVWLEVAHRYSVKVLGRDLTPCTRRIRRGRPGRDGESLHGALTGDGAVRMWRTNGVDRRALGETILRAALPVRRIVWLDQSTSGEVTAVLETARFAADSPYRVAEQRTVVVRLDSALRERDRFSSPWGLTERYQPGEARVAPDGNLWMMAMTRDGALLLRWDGRAP